MLFLQKVSESINTAHIADIKSVKLDRRLATVLSQNLRGFQLRVAIQVFDCFGTALGGACCQVDKEGTRVQWRGGILERKVADYR
jgi:hypothetical protein